MNKETLIAAGINYEEGLHRFAGRAELYEKYLRKLVEDPSFDELNRAMAEKDYALAFRTAHNIKGLTGNLSTNMLYQSACALVEALRDERLHEPPEPLLADLMEKYDQTVAAIKAAD